jgi:hypothetical protein
MRRGLLFLLLLPCLGLAAAPALARQKGPGPGRPIWPPKGATDAQLYAKAMTLQSRTWHHLSPEGLLVYRHRRGATYAELSADSLWLSDQAMWTGCYVAGQVCRWRVTGDPDALAQVRHLAKGLEALSAVTGQPGCFARNVGRPIGQPVGEQIEPSPAGRGLWYRGDVSRDQLTGMVLGWYFIGRYSGDEDLRRRAAVQTARIAHRLYQHGMWIRDRHGKKTRYGELRPDVEYVPLAKNGPLAAIGLATLVAAADLNPQDPQLRQMLGHLDRRGWDDALSSQYTWLPTIIHNSNVHMVTLALLVIALSPQGNYRYAHEAKKGMRVLRKATVGWWNAGICSCYLLGGSHRDRRTLLGEVRATLHALPDGEKPRRPVREFHADRIAPIWERPIADWHWTGDPRWHVVWEPGGELPEKVWWTGADWLYAYWFSRAAGHLTPLAGPGAKPKAHRCAVDYPPWMRRKAGDGAR